jgi:hypothetical protein
VRRVRRIAHLNCILKILILYDEGSENLWTEF